MSKTKIRNEVIGREKKNFVEAKNRKARNQVLEGMKRKIIEEYVDQGLEKEDIERIDDVGVNDLGELPLWNKTLPKSKNYTTTQEIHNLLNKNIADPDLHTSRPVLSNVLHTKGGDLVATDGHVLIEYKGMADQNKKGQVVLT